MFGLVRARISSALFILLIDPSIDPYVCIRSLPQYSNLQISNIHMSICFSCFPISSDWGFIPAVDIGEPKSVGCGGCGIVRLRRLLKLQRSSRLSRMWGLRRLWGTQNTAKAPGVAAHIDLAEVV